MILTMFAVEIYTIENLKYRYKVCKTANPLYIQLSFYSIYDANVHRLLQKGKIV